MRKVQTFVHSDFYCLECRYYGVVLPFFLSMYSQNREEEIIVGLFGQNHIGHFLDVGAYDGRTFSNTLRLTELGWSGVCIEPSPTVFPALLKLHRDNPKVALVNGAVCPSNGFIDFYDSGGDAVSTTVPAHKVKWESKTVQFAKMMVYGITFGDIFRKFGSDFDFINLDVEGMSAALFDLLPLQALQQTKCLCVEHDGKMEEIKDRAAKFGFGYVYHNAENVILFR